LKKIIRENHIVSSAQVLAAIAVGLVAWLFTLASGKAQGLFISAFALQPLYACLAAPLLFLAAAWAVARFAPEARGSGIPQVLQAIDDAAENPAKPLDGALLSLKTVAVKIASALAALLGGASVGREGPTIQIASSLFALASRAVKRLVPLKDPASFLVAGAAAGVAAAFNTPLAGIAFALEELAENSFVQFKGVVLLCVIVAGISARALGGDYLYFGHPNAAEPSAGMLLFSLLAGLLGGLFGGLFSRLLAQKRPRLLPGPWWSKALACGALCAALAYATRGLTAGSGYEAARGFMDDPQAGLPLYFFPAKFMATVLSYLSGVAGGIFSPCLSIGAGMGASAGQLMQMPDLRACALVGMVAFFSGVVHAPLTAVIIIMEMTDQHLLIIPFMVAAFAAHALGKKIMPVPLYRHLASQIRDAEKP
jgi:H+/Cl- antiporter ClcA